MSIILDNFSVFMVLLFLQTTSLGSSIVLGKGFEPLKLVSAL